MKEGQVSSADIPPAPKPPFSFSPSVVDFGASTTQKDVTVSNVMSSSISYEIQLTSGEGWTP